jgi:predicted GH43/DUF377 family glycosyl hydrolase
MKEKKTYMTRRRHDQEIINVYVAPVLRLAYIYIEKALWIRACMQKHMDTRIGTETLWSFSRLRNAIGILLLDHSVKAGLTTYMTDKLG